MQFLADLIVELALAIISFFAERLMRRFPILGKILFILLIILLTGCGTTSVWGGYATWTSDSETARNVSPFLYCFGVLLLMFAVGRILKKLAAKRVYKLVAAVALTVASAALIGVSIWCFISKIYASGTMLIAMFLVCVVYAALDFRGYIKANNGQ